MGEPRAGNLTDLGLHTTLSLSNLGHISRREAPCLSALIPHSRKRYALKALGEETTERHDGAENQESPNPLAVGLLGGRHETEDKQTHRDPDQSYAKGDEHDTCACVQFDVLNLDWSEVVDVSTEPALNL